MSTRCHFTRWELSFFVGVGKKINRVPWNTPGRTLCLDNFINLGAFREQCWGGGHRGHPVWMAQKTEDAEAPQPRIPATLPEKQNKQAWGWRKM